MFYYDVLCREPLDAIQPCQKEYSRIHLCSPFSRCASRNLCDAATVSLGVLLFHPTTWKKMKIFSSRDPTLPQEIRII